MKHNIASALAFAALFLAYGCPNPAPHPIKFGLSKPFTLQMGQAAECAEVKGFIIAFEGVQNDSRCPIDVKCVTAGKADIAIAMSMGDVKKKITLGFVRPDGVENDTLFEGYRVRAIGVMPFRQQDKPIKPDEYSVSFEVAPQAEKKE